MYADRIQLPGMFVLWVFVMVPFLNGQDRTTTPAKDPSSRIQTILTRLHEQGDFSGGSASVVLPNGNVVTVTVGHAYDDAKTPIDQQSRMSSGSIGKSYFAALLMHLVHEGTVKLDDPASKHLGSEPWFNKIPNADEITILQLLRHQSGIPRYVLKPGVWKSALSEPDKKWNGVEQLSYIFDAKPLHQPGRGWAYSDTNYILIALLIEKVTGKTCYEQIDDLFLKPNQLNDTVAADRSRVKNLVSGRSRILKSLGIPERPVVDQRYVFNPQFEWGGGGYICTSADLARWTKIFWSGSAMKKEYVKQLIHDPPSAESYLGKSSRYGIGTIIRTTKLGESYGHDGVFTGYLSACAYFPDHDIAVAIQLTTDRTQDVGKPLHAVLPEIGKAAIGK